MSVEKLSDSSKVYVERSPYTQILNSVIEHIKDNDAFRLYSYLLSKSREWSVVKEWTAKQCSTGERKAKQCWSYLERCGLLEYVPLRNDLGKFIKHDLRILNGSRFKPDEPFLKPSGAEIAPVDSYPQKDPSHRCNNTPSGLSTRVDFAPLLNKDLLPNKEKAFDLKNKDKSFYIEKAKSVDNRKAENEKRHEWADKPKPKPSAHVPRDTMSEEAKTTERGSLQAEEDAMKNLPMNLRPRRYRQESITSNIPPLENTGRMDSGSSEANRQIRNTMEA